jgi:SAM-dependent methyltransferase
MDTEVVPRWGSVLVDPSKPSLPALKVRFLLDNLPSRGRVMEVGCGGGKLLRTLARHRPSLELHGCDVRDPQEPPDVYAFRRIEKGLPYEDASFDAVMLFDVLEHVPDPPSLLAEVARVLKPGGALVAFVPIEGERLSFYELYRKILGRDVYVETKEHVQAFTHGGLADLLGRHFTLDRVRYAYHFLGQAMDASFFAAVRLRSLKAFWWNDNAIYHGTKEGAGLGTKGLNLLLEAGNAVAWLESTLLASTKIGAAGVLAHGVVRRR